MENSVEYYMVKVRHRRDQQTRVDGHEGETIQKQLMCDKIV